MDTEELITETVEDDDRIYLPSFNILRLLCMVLLVVTTFGFTSSSLGIFEAFLNFAPGTLFALYGFLVLYDGADLTKNIKHCLKVFFIQFGIYLVLTMVYLLVINGTPFLYFTKRGIFNFLALNYWNVGFGSTIWLVQATLYALVILWLCRKWKRFDWLLCILTFVFASLSGEFAQAIGFSFLGNDYIPGNFLTRAIPYMLLGRLIRRYYNRIPYLFRDYPFALLLLGGAFSIAEYLLLDKLGILFYSIHLIGYIPVTAALVLIGCYYGEGSIPQRLDHYIKTIYKGIYFFFNPLGYGMLLVGAFVFRMHEIFYYYLMQYLGLLVFVLTVGGSWLFVFLRDRYRLYRARLEQREKEYENDSEEDDSDEA